VCRPGGIIRREIVILEILRQTFATHYAKGETLRARRVAIEYRTVIFYKNIINYTLQLPRSPKVCLQMETTIEFGESPRTEQSPQLRVAGLGISEELGDRPLAWELEYHWLWLSMLAAIS